MPTKDDYTDPILSVDWGYYSEEVDSIILRISFFDLLDISKLKELPEVYLGKIINSQYKMLGSYPKVLRTPTPVHKSRRYTLFAVSIKFPSNHPNTKPHHEVVGRQCLEEYIKEVL